ncbi:hypothetical protein ABGB14_11410 [Nonomuraea sp. B10E15]|uniref:hypothetical protein n=1 Tax=Nonomuraea sp. B10E15 TaxID=3153560 RepID=UPI00325F558E
MNDYGQVIEQRCDAFRSRHHRRLSCPRDLDGMFSRIHALDQKDELFLLMVRERHGAS